MDYKSSGVDIEAGNAFVERLKEKVPTIGGFGGAFKIPSGYEKPVLISGTDGVGTKINIARVFNDYTTIGEDLVAMCVNDIICSGAKPLYFLDYISTGKIEQDILGQVMQGILKGCEIADMQLLGGETAEHPRQNGYDLAGFCTGIVEENEIIDGRLIKEGDKIIGIESSGLHSNGYSLINDMLWRHKIYYKETPELITPTTIYAPVVKELLETQPILGMAHITGGGIPENLPRCIPEGLKPQVDYNSWPLPDIFQKVMLAGEIVEDEMKKVFNLGIGFCLIVPPDVEDEVRMIITPYHECWTIGEVVVE
jgi:phosphoribosylformylglycinamidine cyclo-ligase